MADLSFLEKEKLHTGFGNDIISPKNYDDVLEQAGLNWDVNTYEAYCDYQGTMMKVPHTNVVVRTQDNKVLGTVSDRYQIVQNDMAFAFTEELFNSNDIVYVRGGSYRGGKSTWLQAKINSEYKILGDSVETYVIFRNSHDGKGSVIAMLSPTRLACSNVLNLALKESPRVWRCTHSGDPLKKIEDAKEVLLFGTEYMKALEKEAERLNKISLTETQVDDFINRLYKIHTEMSDAQIKHKIVDRENLKKVYTDKDDLQNFGKNGYRFISAVIDYVDHAPNLRDTKTANENRFMNVVSGHGVVDTAYQMLMAL